VGTPMCLDAVQGRLDIVVKKQQQAPGRRLGAGIAGGGWTAASRLLDQLQHEGVALRAQHILSPVRTSVGNHNNFKHSWIGSLAGERVHNSAKQLASVVGGNDHADPKTDFRVGHRDCLLDLR
jgi:hypothetical protein